MSDEKNTAGKFEQLVRSMIVGELGTEQRLMLALAIGLDRSNARIELLLRENQQFTARVTAIARESQRGNLRS